MCAGMAKQGMIPVFAVYSTFLQRSYDMLIHDVALQNLHVVFCVDRAGLVGEDGETHHGVFDVGFLDTVPGMTVLCPACFSELKEMLRWAVGADGPVAVRYPRGGEGRQYPAWAGEGASLLRSGTDVTLVAYGTLADEVLTAAELLGKLAQLAGFHPSGEPRSAAELLSEFDWEQVPREDIRLPGDLF